jgi:glycosyltransferase involved in cell wall biosynthesis
LSDFFSASVSAGAAARREGMETPLRIGYYLEHWPGGGMARHLLELIDHFRPAHEIVVFVNGSPDSRGFFEALRARGITPRETRATLLQPTGILKHVAVSVPAIFAARSVLVRERLDVIHFHAGHLAHLYAPIVASRLARIPARIATVHNPLARRSRLHRSIEGRVLGSLDRIVTVAHALKAELMEKKNAAPEKIVVVFNGVDVAEFSSNPADARRALGLPETAAVVGMVARVSRDKGADVLIRAAARIKGRTPDLRVVFIGGAREIRDFRTLAETEGVSDIVLFAGYRADARRLMQAMDIVVLPTRLEGSPYAILEAMAAGKPVVASRIGGVPELVVDGATGRLFPMDDVAALAAALTELLEDPKKRAAMGAAGRARVEKYFSQTVMLERMAALYKNPTA